MSWIWFFEKARRFAVQHEGRGAWASRWKLVAWLGCGAGAAGVPAGVPERARLDDSTFSARPSTTWGARAVAAAFFRNI